MKDLFEKDMVRLKKMLENVTKENETLKQKLDKNGDDKTGSDETEKLKLKKMDHKHLEKPGKYNGEPTEFLIWYEFFYNYLISCDEKWKNILDGLRSYGNAPIKNNEVIKNELLNANRPGMARQYQEYARQLYMYLLSCTTEDINSKVLKATVAEVFDTYREIIYKGFNMHSERLITLEGSMYQPRRAKNEKDFDKAYTEWKYVLTQVQNAGGTVLTESAKKTLMLQIFPENYVPHMRKEVRKQKDARDFVDEFIKEVFNRTGDTTGRKTVNAVSVEPQPRKANDEDATQPEWEQGSVYSEEWGCWICGIMPKRQRTDDGDIEMTPANPSPSPPRPAGKAGWKGAGKSGKTRPKGPCWNCGGPHYARECPSKGNGKGPPTPTTAAWNSWYPVQQPGPSKSTWKSWFPGANGKGKGKGKGKSGKGGVRAVSWQDWPAWGPPLGQVADQTGGSFWWHHVVLRGRALDERFH